MTTSSVQLGLWTDHSKSDFWGQNWTATAGQGLLLVSFLALFVAAVSRHAWGILRYCLHQIRSSGAPRDGLYHQQQLVLRNSATPITALWRFSQLAWAWRGRPEARSVWTFPPLLAALTQICIFAIASIYSSQVLGVSDVVLVQSANCGYQAYSAGPGPLRNTTDFGMLNAAIIESQEAMQASASYAKRCYGNNTVDECESFAVQRLSMSSNSNADCPFEASMCLDGSQGAFEVDTGLIRTDTQLGINTDPSISLLYRRVTTCSPLRTAGYSSWREQTANETAPQYLDFSYGSYLTTPSGPTSAETFTYDAATINYSTTAFPVTYRFAALKPSKSTNFVPIQSLYRDDADVFLLFLENNADFVYPVEDLWYHATVPTPDTYGFGTWIYNAIQPVTVMGCAEQHQLCDPSLSESAQCSALTGWSALRDSHIYSGPRASISQALYNAVSNSLLRDIFFWLGTDALLASENVHGVSSFFTGSIPSNQWQLEVQSWQATALAQMQRLVANVAGGPSQPASTEYVIAPIGSSFDICTNQKIRTPGYSSFSMVGLATVIGIGLAIIVTNLILPSIVAKVCRYFKIGARAREDWDLDGIFQVQRLAYQEAKLGTWSSRERRIPTTLQSLIPERFRKPGRTVPVYEQLELEDQVLDDPEATLQGYQDEEQPKDRKVPPTFHERSIDSRRSSIDIVPAYESDDEEAQFVDPRTYGTGTGIGTTAARNSLANDDEDDEQGFTYDKVSRPRESVDHVYYDADADDVGSIRAKSFV